MAINDVVSERVYYVGDIFYEFLGHNFVSRLRTLKSLKKPLTRCSAIAERPRYRVRYSFRQK